MIYEYRAYTCLPGRLPALLDRFRTTTLGLWEKHGIRTAGFWTVEVGENNQVLHYLLAWESLAEREEKWPGFVTDPDWISARPQARRPARSSRAFATSSGGRLTSRRCSSAPRHSGG